MNQHFARLDRSELKRRVAEAEGYASRVAGEVASEARERVVISYTGSGDIPAYTAYWILREVAPTAPVEIYPGDALAFHILAYRRSGRDEYSVASDTTIILFAGPGGENQLLLVRDAAVHTGAGLVVVAPRLPPLIEERLGPEPLLVEPPDPYPLGATILAARVAAVLAARMGERNVRVERVGRETGDVASIVDDLLERHGGDAERVAGCHSCVYTHTPTMRGPALLAARMSGGFAVGVQELLGYLAAGGSTRGVALLYTSADEDVVRELRFKCMSRGASIVELRMATDPVTAPLYATILLYAGGR